MSRRLVFLGWDRPFIQAVTEWMIPTLPLGPPDFSRQWILVPTRQAGRRLRQALASRCALGETGLLGLRVTTPAMLLAGGAGRPDAPPMLIKAVWANVLREAAPDAFPALLPVKMTERSWRWALQTGALLQGLREQLAEADLGMDDVPRKAGERLPEPERWQALADLEARFLKALEVTGYGDPVMRKRALPLGDALPEDTESIVLAGVPDPPILALRLLERLARSIPVTVLVHAPESMADTFDRWGRPLPDAWSTRSLPIPDDENSLILAANPEDQARLALRELDAHAVRFGMNDVGLGVPDPEVASFLEQALSEWHVTVMNPAEPPLSRQPVCRLLAMLPALTGPADYPTLSRILRHEDVLEALVHRFALSPALLLTELDTFQNAFLPVGLEDFTEPRLQGYGPVPDMRNTRFPGLEKAIRFVRELRTSLTRQPSLTAGVRLAMQMVYGHRRVSDALPQDRTFTAAAGEINSALSELESVFRLNARFTPAEGMEILTYALGERTLPREQEQADLDLEGWLELAWNPAPFLLITGLNEGIVPESRIGDVFLPDSLRVHLGMRDDSSRLARDLFILNTLLACREQSGTVRLLCGKASLSGDPLRPSRLLFHCPDDLLPARAARLFEPLKGPRSLPPASISFRLRPNLPGRPVVWPAERPIGVTAFRDYLECPFRFYLKHLLRLETLDDLKTEPDAREFGQLIHYALRALHDIPELRNSSDETRLREALQAAARQWLNSRYGEDASLSQRIVAEAAQNRLAAVARRQADEAANGWTILAAETAWALPLGGLTIKGKIDRIDFHPDTRAVRILDYKTSAAGKTCQEAHLASARAETPPFAALEIDGKRKRWTDLQLPLYAQLWNAKPLKEASSVSVGYFLVPPAMDDTQVQVWDDFAGALLDSSRDCAEHICQAVRKGLFWPPADRVMFEDLYRDAVGGELDAVFAPLPPGGAS